MGKRVTMRNLLRTIEGIPKTSIYEQGRKNALIPISLGEQRAEVLIRGEVSGV